MAWFSKRQTLKAQTTSDKPTGPVPAKKGEGLWTKCDGCGEVIYTQEWEGNWNVCPGCGHHDALPARRRLEMVLDPDTFEELDTELVPEDPLGFTDAKKYRDRLKSTYKATGMRDAFISGTGTITGQPVSIGTFAFEFMGGSMGSVVGEKVARVIDRAYERRCPCIVFSFRQVRKPYVSVMLHPTTGGVAASFAWLGDVIIAEPKALIGFAGPRVIEQTIREKLPPGFQRSEFLLERGMIDAIVPRLQMRERLAQIISLLG
jgi:acetyl-CoA carboxylase carboxyl transferase subunit beta